MLKMQYTYLLRRRQAGTTKQVRENTNIESDNENKVDSECYCAASMAFVSEKLGGAEPPHLHNMDKNENMKLIATLGVICKALSKCFCKIHRKCN